MKTIYLVLLIAFFFSYSCTTTTRIADKSSDSSPTRSVQTIRTAEKGISMRVLWTITEYKFGAATQWEKKEVEKQLFKTLDIDEQSMRFDGKECRNIHFTKEIKAAAEALLKFDITPQALGIKDEKLEIVKTNCDLPGFGEYIRLADRRLLVKIKGVFFFFEPAMQY